MRDFIVTHSGFLIPLAGGFLLDALLGDPARLPHPIRLFGNMIAFCEQKFNRGGRRRTKGIAVASGLVLLVFGILCGLQLALRDFPAVKAAANTLLFFYALGNRSLIEEAWKVERRVRKNDLPAARRQLSRIVGRDTSRLSFQQVRTATLETLAENLGDGVVAPLFFYALGGIPMMMAYKMINTLDSMIGYKNERHNDFGWFAARVLDDGANYVPARLTALLMIGIPPSPRGFRFVRKYARRHPSPNSGYPESALAGILDCRFGGPGTYGGKRVEKPYIGKNHRELTHGDVVKSCAINIRTSLLMLVCTVALYCFFHGSTGFIA